MKIIFILLLMISPYSQSEENIIYIDILGKSKYLLNNDPILLVDILGKVRAELKDVETKQIVLTAYRNTLTDDLIKVVNTLKSKEFKITLQSDNRER